MSVVKSVISDAVIVGFIYEQIYGSTKGDILTDWSTGKSAFNVSIFNQ